MLSLKVNTPWIALALALSALPVEALACPDCATGRAARASVLDADLGRNLLAMLAPFLVVGLVTASLHRSGARRLAASQADAFPLKTSEGDAS